MRLVPAVAVAVLALSACGGADRHAGLTREEADDRVSAALRAAQASGAIAQQLQEAIGGLHEEAMARAGGAERGSAGPRVLQRGATMQKGAIPGRGRPAWVASRGLAGLGTALVLCLYVWDGGSSIDVRGRCT